MIERVTADVELIGQLTNLFSAHGRALGASRDVERGGDLVLGEKISQSQVQRAAVVPARGDVNRPALGTVGRRGIARRWR